MPVNDLSCRRCDRLLRDLRYRIGEEPVCCGTPMAPDWRHGQAPATDLHAPRSFSGLDGIFSSHRQAEREAERRAKRWNRQMEARGMPMSWEIHRGGGGDKVGGARDVRRVQGKAFDYRGQGRRTSTGESKLAAHRSVG